MRLALTLLCSVRCALCFLYERMPCFTWLQHSCHKFLVLRRRAENAIGRATQYRQYNNIRSTSLCTPPIQPFTVHTFMDNYSMLLFACGGTERKTRPGRGVFPHCNIWSGGRTTCLSILVNCRVVSLFCTAGYAADADACAIEPLRRTLHTLQHIKHLPVACWQLLSEPLRVGDRFKWWLFVRDFFCCCCCCSFCMLAVLLLPPILLSCVFKTYLCRCKRAWSELHTLGAFSWWKVNAYANAHTYVHCFPHTHARQVLKQVASAAADQWSESPWMTISQVTARYVHGKVRTKRHHVMQHGSICTDMYDATMAAAVVHATEWGYKILSCPSQCTIYIYCCAHALLSVHHLEPWNRLLFALFTIAIG